MRSVIVSLFVLLGLLFSELASAATLDTARYLPHTAGNQWSYINNNYDTMTNNFGSQVTLPSGVVAIPWTRVDSNTCVSSCVTYNTFDANGWLRYQEYIGRVYISGYGNTSATSVFAPALSFAPANVTIGSTYTSTGAVTITYTNVTTFTLNYTSTTQIVGFETVSNNAGSQSWSALKVNTSVTMSGTVNGQFLTITSASTYWLVDGLGMVKAYAPNASGVMETWKLTSTNVEIPKASQTIGTISFSSSSSTVGDTSTASANATSGLAVNYSSVTPSICTVSGSTVTSIAPGVCTIAANQAGDTSYSAATQVTQNITVSAATTSPACILSASPSLVSAGSSSLLAAICSPTATSYLWVGGTCAGTSGASCTVTPSATTIYTVAGVNNAGSGAVSAATVTVAPLGSILVIEFYNTALDNYFITADSGEAAQIDNGSAGPGWIRTGNTFNSGGSTSVCRFYGSYSPGPNSHFYTVDSGECQGLKDQQFPAGDPRILTDKSWNFESMDFVSTPATNQTCPSGTTPVYRAYNNGFTRNIDSNHRITSSLTAIQEVVVRGWSNEGVVMCAPN